MVLYATILDPNVQTCIHVIYRIKPLFYRYFFALALTRASNIGLLIGLYAVWNGFSSV